MGFTSGWTGAPARPRGTCHYPFYDRRCDRCTVRRLKLCSICTAPNSTRMYRTMPSVLLYLIRRAACCCRFYASVSIPCSYTLLLCVLSVLCCAQLCSCVCTTCSAACTLLDGRHLGRARVSTRWAGKHASGENSRSRENLLPEKGRFQKICLETLLSELLTFFLVFHHGRWPSTMAYRNKREA